MYHIVQKGITVHKTHDKEKAKELVKLYKNARIVKRRDKRGRQGQSEG